jgi:hypothetical protein
MRMPLPAPPAVTARYDWHVIDTPLAGLCARCAWRRDVVTATSWFVLCTRALDDPAFSKYPRLPVIHCSGYTAAPPDRAPAGKVG